jgi:hypothetical protein
LPGPGRGDCIAQLGVRPRQQIHARGRMLLVALKLPLDGVELVLGVGRIEADVPGQGRLMRLGVPLPGAVQNYLFGLTRIDVVTYAISTLVFTAPQVLLYSFLGATGRATLLDQNLGVSLIALALIIAMVVLIGWRVRVLLSRRAPLA